jgi:hypothetical protein
MSTASLARRLEKLEAELRALAEARTPTVTPFPALDVETIREALRVLIEIGAVELDGGSIRWKEIRDERQDDGRPDKRKEQAG